MDSRPWPCPPCGEITPFVQPPCTDGHIDDGVECPEWVCADCGSAFFVGDVDVVPEVLRLRQAA